MPHFRVRACRHSFINHIQALCRRQSNVGAQNHHCNTYESCLAFRRLHVLEGSTKKQQRVSWIHPLASMTCSKLAPSRLEPLKPPSMCTHHPPLRKTSLTPVSSSQQDPSLPHSAQSALRTPTDVLSHLSSQRSAPCLSGAEPEQRACHHPFRPHLLNSLHLRRTRACTGVQTG
jgi:hypothetical protein